MGSLFEYSSSYTSDPMGPETLRQPSRAGPLWADIVNTLVTQIDNKYTQTTGGYRESQDYSQPP